MKENNQEHIDIEQNELDDIVLEKFEKKDRLKKLLLLGSSLVLIFIIVVSIVKIVTTSTSTPQDRLVEENRFASVAQETHNGEFEEVPIVAEENTPPSTPDTDQEFKKVINEVIKKETKLQAQQNIAPQPKPKPAQKPAPQQKQKPTQKSPIAKKRTPSKPVQKVVKKGRYYIQVGAFLKYAPDKNFLRKIKRAGFSYVIKKFHQGGKNITRVYIGPFASRKEAKKVLGTVRRKITKNAFITRI